MDRKLKVAILYENWGDEELVPAEPEKKKRARGKKKKRREKHDFEEIFEALEKIGHEPSYEILDGTDKTLFALNRCEADLFFNLVQYKVLAKKIFAFHGIRTPFFAISYQGTLEHSHDISFPLIVKPSAEDASIGIDKDSVVNSVKELMERIHYIQEEFDSPALVEEYIEGREIYAGILGNESPEVLPLVELDLSRLPAGMPKVAGTEVKWEKESEAYKSTKSAPVEDLDEETTERMGEIALSAYRILKLRDYGRIDMRLTDKGEIYVIEANPNPWLSSNSEFFMAAKKSGRSYADMVGDIVDLARARHAAV